MMLLNLNQAYGLYNWFSCTLSLIWVTVRTVETFLNRLPKPVCRSVITRHPETRRRSSPAATDAERWEIRLQKNPNHREVASSRRRYTSPRNYASLLYQHNGKRKKNARGDAPLEKPPSPKLRSAPTVSSAKPVQDSRSQ
ncbi:hypothetical protein Bca4012_009805 [Brassica carinata]